jgi:hypothetical protein
VFKGLFQLAYFSQVPTSESILLLVFSFVYSLVYSFDPQLLAHHTLC